MCMYVWMGGLRGNGAISSWGGGLDGFKGSNINIIRIYFDSTILSLYTVKAVCG